MLAAESEITCEGKCGRAKEYVTAVAPRVDSAGRISALSPGVNKWVSLSTTSILRITDKSVVGLHFPDPFIGVEPVDLTASNGFSENLAMLRPVEAIKMK